jgi:hypothetical protein
MILKVQSVQQKTKLKIFQNMFGGNLCLDLWHNMKYLRDN